MGLVLRDERDDVSLHHVRAQQGQHLEESSHQAPGQLRLNLGLPAFRTIRSKCLWFKLHSL